MDAFIDTLQHLQIRRAVRDARALPVMVTMDDEDEKRRLTMLDEE